MNAEKIAYNLACLTDYSLFDAIRIGKEQGFQSIGFATCSGSRHSLGVIPGFRLSELSNDMKSRILAEIADYKHVSTHVVFIDVPLFSYNKRTTAESLRQVEESIDTSAFLGAHVTAAHANPKGFFELEEYWQEMIDTFRHLGDYGGERDVKIGIETGFPSTIDTYVNLIKEIDHPYVGATIDIGHVPVYVQPDLRQTDAGVAELNRCLVTICAELGPKVYHLHVHDVRASDWRDHRTAGTGILDLKACFECLADAGYDGMFEFELEEEDREGSLAASKRHVEQVLATVMQDRD